MCLDRRGGLSSRRRALRHLREDVAQALLVFGMLLDRLFDRPGGAVLVALLQSEVGQRDPGVGQLRIGGGRGIEQLLSLVLLPHCHPHDRLIRLRARLVRVLRQNGGGLFEDAHQVLAVEIGLGELDARLAVVGIRFHARFELLECSRSGGGGRHGCRRFRSRRFGDVPAEEEQGGDGASAPEEAGNG